MKKLRKEKDTTFVVPFSWRGAMRLGRTASASRAHRGHYARLPQYQNVEDVLPLENHCLLVFFRDGAVKKCDLQKHFEKTKAFQILLKKPDYFQHVQMQTGGYGVAWDVNMTVSDAMLYRIGKSVPLTAADFRNFAAHRVINTAEAAEILGYSRQNIIDLTKRGKLHPIKSSEKSTLYLKSEILKRNWQ